MLGKTVATLGVARCTPIPLIRTARGNVRLAPLSTEFSRAAAAISVPTNYNWVNVPADGMVIDQARNYAVAAVMNHDVRPEFLFFLAYDVLPEFDCLTKLIYRAKHFPDHDIFSGVYCCKSSPAEPLIYKGNGLGPFWDWTVGDLLQDGVTGVHMGLTLVRTTLFEKMKWDDEDEPLFLTQNTKVVDEAGLHAMRGTEDLYFCERAIQEADAQIFVDTSILAGHQDSEGKIFGLPMDSRPVLGAKWLDRSKDYADQKKALDIGAGLDRREWPGYITYRTDIRDDVGADYVMDSRQLELPQEHFDLIASSHHLEHLPRWQQGEIWDTLFKITKRGGRCEHVVPNVKWAAAMIEDGKEDEHVYNVLYGAQEDHGYKREFNTHYSGYTPHVARCLAEDAGYVDVEIEDYTTDEGHLYNLIVRGRRPAIGEDKKGDKIGKRRKRKPRVVTGAIGKKKVVKKKKGAKKDGAKSRAGRPADRSRASKSRVKPASRAQRKSTKRKRR